MNEGNVVEKESVNINIMPLVSICCITYNHERYIRDTIEGFLIQKTNFSYEILIHDDASTDNTKNIIKEYENKYPELIKVIYQRQNQYSIGIRPINKFNFERSKGKYVAMCEGDDYWTDPYKLQKQVDFLEEHTDCSSCFTNAKIIDRNNNFERLFVNGLAGGYLDNSAIIYKGGGLYPTASLVFNKNMLDNEIFNHINEIAGDELLIMSLASNGKIYYMNEITCVYRNWQGGIFSSIKNDASRIFELKRKSIDGYRKFDLFTKGKFHNLIQRKISIVSLYIILNSKGLQKYKYLFRLHPVEWRRLISKKWLK